MKSTFLILLSLFSFLSIHSQHCSERYKNRIFNTIQIHRDVIYTKNAPKLIGSSLGIETIINRDLKMDIFFPPTTDTVQNRPVVIVAHGGGFIDVAFMGGTLLVGVKENDDVQALCDSLAHRGFIAAAIEYRTGFDVASTTSIKRAVWRGAQDMSSAIRFFRKNAQLLGVNPAQIFISGSSAGAFCAIHSCFVDFYERIPESYAQGMGMNNLGALHSRPIVQLTGTNPYTGNNVSGQDIDSLPLAVASYWGAIADSSFFYGNNKAPVIMFHGDNDIVVSHQCARPFSNVVLAAPATCGSEVMFAALQGQSIDSKLFIESGQGHEYWGALNGSWLPSGPNAFWKNIIDSTISFYYHYAQPQIPVLNLQTSYQAGQIYSFQVQNHQADQSYCWSFTNATIISNNQSSFQIQVQFDSNATVSEIQVSTLSSNDFESQQQINLIQLSQTSSLENISENNFSIYPNPAQEKIYIENSLDEEPMQIHIFNSLGQGIFKNQSDDKQMEIDTYNWQKGIYLFECRNRRGTFVKKIIIQ